MEINEFDKLHSAKIKYQHPTENNDDHEPTNKKLPKYFSPDLLIILKHNLKLYKKQKLIILHILILQELVIKI